MKALVLALLVSSAGCANVHVNRATLIASTVSLLVDGAQTYRAASSSWSGPCGPQYEANPIMGTRPSTVAVGSYFGTAILLNAALWAVLPDRYKSVVPVAIIGAQVRTVVDNYEECRR